MTIPVAFNSLTPSQDSKMNSTLATYSFVSSQLSSMQASSIIRLIFPICISIESQKEQ